MGELLGDIVDWMAALPAIWAYATILVIAYGENVVPPIPGDMIVVFGGYLAGVGQLSFTLVIVLSTLGGVLGFMTMYAIGRRIGDAVLDPARLRWLPKKQIGKARGWMQRWGYGVVAANRFLSGARSVISLTVGMARMPAGRTTAFAALSAFVWTLLIGYAGYAVGDNWEVVGQYLRDYGRVMVTLLVAVGIAVAARRWHKRRSAASAGQPAGRTAGTEEGTGKAPVRNP